MGLRRRGAPAWQPWSRHRRALRERLREAARRLSVRGELCFVQGGQVVDPSSARGSVGLLRMRAGTDSGAKR